MQPSLAQFVTGELGHLKGSAFTAGCQVGKDRVEGT